MKHYFFFLLLLFQIKVLSQEIYNKYRSPVKFFLDGGVTWQTADIKKKCGPGFSSGIEFSFFENETNLLSFSLRPHYVKGWTYGRDLKPFTGDLTVDAINGNIGFPNPNFRNLPVFLNNKTNYHEGSLEALIRANRLRSNHKIILFGYGSLGFNSFKTTADHRNLLGLQYDYQPLLNSTDIKTDLNLLRDYEYETFLSKQTSFTPTVGIGLGFEIFRNVDLVWEYKLAFPFTDKFDGHNINVRKGNDKYHYTSLGFFLGLGNYGYTKTNIVNNNIPIIPLPNVEITQPEQTQFLGTCKTILIAKTENVLSLNDILVTHNDQIIPRHLYFFDSKEGTVQLNVNLHPGINTFLIKVTRNGQVASDEITLQCSQYPEKLVKICFDGKVLEVKESELANYLKQGATQGPCPEKLVKICFNNKVLEVKESELANYLKQGATQGPCPEKLVKICFDGKVLEVKESELANYLKQGATQGPCSESKKIKICHLVVVHPLNKDPYAYTQEIEIDEKDWQNHESHGDIKGLCGENPEITLCLDGQEIKVKVNETTPYIKQGAKAGSCNNLNEKDKK